MAVGLRVGARVVGLLVGARVVGLVGERVVGFVGDVGLRVGALVVGAPWWSRCQSSHRRACARAG